MIPFKIKKKRKERKKKSREILSSDLH